MTAGQLIDRYDGSYAGVRGIGRIRYTHSGGHDHWPDCSSTATS
jgi:hypothetical protein